MHFRTDDTVCNSSARGASGSGFGNSRKSFWRSCEGGFGTITSELQRGHGSTRPMPFSLHRSRAPHLHLKRICTLRHASIWSPQRSHLAYNHLSSREIECWIDRMLSKPIIESTPLQSSSVLKIRTCTRVMPWVCHFPARKSGRDLKLPKTLESFEKRAAFHCFFSTRPST